MSAFWVLRNGYFDVIVSRLELCSLRDVFVAQKILQYEDQKIRHKIWQASEQSSVKLKAFLNLKTKFQNYVFSNQSFNRDENSYFI